MFFSQSTRGILDKMAWSVAGAFRAAVPTLFGRANDEKIGVGRCPSTEGGELRRRSVVSVVFMRVRAHASEHVCKNPRQAADIAFDATGRRGSNIKVTATGSRHTR